MKMDSFKIEVPNIKQPFYSNEDQKKSAESYIEALQDTLNADKAIATKSYPLQLSLKLKNTIKISIKESRTLR